MTTPFLGPVKQKSTDEVVSITETQFLLTIRAMTNDSHLVQLFSLWSSHSLSSDIFKEAIADPLSNCLL